MACSGYALIVGTCALTLKITTNCGIKSMEYDAEIGVALYRIAVSIILFSNNV